MTALLWDDVPDKDRETTWWRVWRGCPYAVKYDTYDDRYVRCAGASRDGAPCAVHDPSRRPPPREIMLRRIRAMIHRERPPMTLMRFRALTDNDIDNMRYVGVKIADLIREIRDTWDDERVMDCFDLPKEAPASHPDPTVFWAARPDVFNVVGG